MNEISLQEFGLSLIMDKESEGKYSTAHVYRHALNAALIYGGASLTLNELTPGWLHAYEAALIARRLLWNSISTYMRMLRAMYNCAVDRGLVPYIPHQFKGVFTGRQVNHQRALEACEMRKLLLTDEEESVEETAEVAEKDAETLNETEAFDEKAEAAASAFSRHDLKWARACMELMLRFHGLSFVDLAHLRKSDLRDGRIVIRRHKTGMPLSIEVAPEAMKLLCRYAHPDPASPFLLDILDGHLAGIGAYKDYQHILRLFNLRLSQLSRRQGVHRRVSSYCARHTWAAVAKSCGIPVEVISEGLGHASISTTQGYLKQFEGHVMTKANAVVINYIIR